MTFLTLDAIHLAIGSRRGYTPQHKFGRNTAIGTNFTPLTSAGVYPTPQASGATALRVKAGGDANDTAAGTGAQSVIFQGLDGNFDYAEEEVATAGASASVATTTLFTRLFRLKVGGSGTYASSVAGSHAGSITVENAAGTADWGMIDVNGFPRSTSDIAAYSVPRNHIAIVSHIDLFTDTARLTQGLFFIRENIDQTEAPYTPMRVFADFTVEGGHLEHSYDGVPVAIEGPADFGFMVKVDAGTALVTGAFEFILLDKTQAA